MDDRAEWITIAQAARRLNRERSGVTRRARAGDFGPIREMGAGLERPALLLVSAAAVERFRQADIAAAGGGADE